MRTGRVKSVVVCGLLERLASPWPDELSARGGAHAICFSSTSDF